ncbi:hypothetical protein C0033_15165 [Clostridium sp. chh4-2]|uniref:hypothetical protein n=1 Tax=Clostridium sp. chh4-2 TaxID=2067550 RepID=UPI000CCE2337|nr:hypothetical protein [Clostridium sp. chh4-2]PNV61322.1 hypothetical protein C0033_15165 [Clostridium sp. chh4-2]
MKEKKHSHFEILKNPYDPENTESLEVIYQKYIDDPEAIVEINGMKFYKIIQLFQLQTNKIISVAALDSGLKLRMKDTLVDEKKNCFTINGFEMLHFRSDIFPEWYLKLTFVSIIGEIENIGEYLALYDKT